MSLPSLEPTPYHRQLVALLGEHEAEMWAGFATRAKLEEWSDETRLELLKNTVRLDEETHAGVYRAAEQAAVALGLEGLERHCYQAPTSPMGVNASLYFVPEALHVVLQGDVIGLLDEDELLALFGHEYAHHRLWGMDEGAYLVADRLLSMNAGLDHSEPAQVRTAENQRLFTELVADRGAALAAGSWEAAVRCLVKVETGLAEASAQAYLEQAREVLEAPGESGEVTAGERTHPETYMRAHAVERWFVAGAEAEAELARLVKGPLRLQGLDFEDQVRLAVLTRRWVSLVLAPAWMRTELLVGHVRLLFADWSADESTDESADPGLIAELRGTLPGLESYWLALLLDLALVDPSLEDLPMVRALVLAQELGLREAFEGLARTELGMTKKLLTQLWRDRESLLEAAEKLS
ncbi:MAG: hypothetical protein ACI9HE_002042 [Planctomycetota bacterium]